ncbi:uroporphyrinogen decarboxylase family protein, partial [candidate division CSSED10-310 bacterium]
MATITGRDRIKAAYKRTFADRIPFYPIAGSFTAQVAKHSIRDYLQQTDCFVESQMAFYEKYKPDVIVMLADLLLEAEAMGTELKFPENAICEVVADPLADKSNLSRLGVPDPHQDGRLPYFLEACRLISKEVSDSAIGSTICGPWAIACALRGVEAMIYDTMDDPDFVHQLMQLTTKVVIEFASAVRQTGVGISLSEAPASCSLISPDIFKEYIKPYYHELVDTFKAQKTGLTIHICGFIDPIMDQVCDCGFAAISIDSLSSLQKMVEVDQGRSVIIGQRICHHLTDSILRKF